MESPYHKYCNAGHILYVELDGDVSKNWEVIETINDTMYNNNAGYWSINHVTSKCIDCGYESFNGQMEKCPKCGSDKITIIERITGYLVGTLQKFNSYKLDEVNHRVSHTSGNDMITNKEYWK